MQCGRFGCGRFGSKTFCSTGPLSDLRYHRPLSDLYRGLWRYRQVRLDLRFSVLMRPPGAIAADYSRLPSAIPGHHRGLRDVTRYGDKDIRLWLTEQITEPIVFWFVIFGFVTKYVIHCMFELIDWRQRNTRFSHLYENLNLQDRLV